MSKQRQAWGSVQTTTLTSVELAVKAINGVDRNTIHREAMKTPNNMNPDRAGNILEQLCWHAFENGREEFVIALVWQAANRDSADGCQKGCSPLLNLSLWNARSCPICRIFIAVILNPAFSKPFFSKLSNIICWTSIMEKYKFVLWRSIIFWTNILNLASIIY